MHRRRDHVFNVLPLIARCIADSGFANHIISRRCLTPQRDQIATNASKFHEKVFRCRIRHAGGIQWFHSWDSQRSRGVNGWHVLLQCSWFSFSSFSCSTIVFISCKYKYYYQRHGVHPRQVAIRVGSCFVGGRAQSVDEHDGLRKDLAPTLLLHAD